MRSPWQLIKGFTSRRKVEGASAPVDEVVPTPDPRKEEVAQDRLRQAQSNTAPDSISASHVNNGPSIEQTNPSEAEANEPDPVIRTDPLLSERVSDDAPEPHDQPSPAAPVVQAVEPEPSVSSSAGDRKEHHVNAVQAQKGVIKPTVVKKAAQRPEVTKKTVLEETIELDREINDLRSQLSAKLLKQNSQLRRMLERYSDK